MGFNRNQRFEFKARSKTATAYEIHNRPYTQGKRKPKALRPVALLLARTQTTLTSKNPANPKGAHFFFTGCLKVALPPGHVVHLEQEEAVSPSSVFQATPERAEPDQTPPFRAGLRLAGQKSTLTGNCTRCKLADALDLEWDQHSLRGFRYPHREDGHAV